MTQEFDVAVVGGGSYGTSTAYHLAARGRSVALIDRYLPATQTSPRAAGLAVQIYANDHLSRISIRSIRKLRRFAEETGEPLDVHVTGSIKVARSETDARQVERELTRGRRLGIDVSPLERWEAARLVPWVDPSEAVAMWYAPDDLYLEPGSLPRAYAAAAERTGVKIMTGVDVRAMEAVDGGDTELTTSAGSVRAAAVVLAAGAWVPGLTRAADVQLPVVPIRHMLLVTEPLPSVRPEHPCVRIIDTHSYLRPEGNGLLFGAYEPDPLVWNDEPPADVADVPLDESPLRAVAARMARIVPGLADAPARLIRGGLPMMTPDGGWIIDRLPVMGSVWILTGDNVAGLGPSPALGEDLATWIATGERPAPLAPFALDRFDELDNPQLQSACCHAYEERYRDGT